MTVTVTVTVTVTINVTVSVVLTVTVTMTDLFVRVMSPRDDLCNFLLIPLLGLEARNPGYNYCGKMPESLTVAPNHIKELWL